MLKARTVSGGQERTLRGVRLNVCRPARPGTESSRNLSEPMLPVPSTSGRRAVTVKAGSDAGAAAVPAPTPAPSPSVITGKQLTYLLMWYAFNIVFNIVNKSTLNVFPCPWFLSTLQLGCGVIIMGVLWGTKIVPFVKVNGDFIKALAPVALFHLIGHVSACLSFSQMAVSFAHVVKAAEPVFSVILSGPLLGVTFIPAVWLSLVPIVVGCSMAAMKEVSFAWGGFNMAMVSNLGMVMRNIYSSKYLKQFKHVDGINQYAWISIMAFLYEIPLAIYFEGALWPAAWQAACNSLGGVGEMVKMLAWGGLFYHLYNQSSYMVLDTGISAVTFSVGNTMKRVAVVVSSILFFKNPVGIMNWVGSGVAILGTYLYSLAMEQQKEHNKKVAAKKAAAVEGKQ